MRCRTIRHDDDDRRRRVEKKSESVVGISIADVLGRESCRKGPRSGSVATVNRMPGSPVDEREKGENG